MRRTVLLLSLVGAMIMVYAGPVLAQTRIPPDLAITYQDGPTKVQPGTIPSYTVYVENKGGSSATIPAGTVIAKRIVTGATFNSCSWNDDSWSYNYPCQGAGTDTVVFAAEQDITLRLGQRLYLYAHVDAPTTDAKITTTFTLDPNNAIAEASESNNISDTITTYVGTPPKTDLSVTQTDNADPVDIDGYLSYTVKVTNNGEDTAFDTVVEDYLPDNATFESAYGGYSNCNHIPDFKAVVCPMGDIPSGQSRVMEVQVTPKAVGTISNSATVYNENDDPDLSNNTSKEETTVKPAPDYASPDTNITSGPSGIVKSTSAAFEFSSTEEGSTFECSLDYADFAPCASPQNYSDLANGYHDFQVRAVDASGNRDYEPANQVWSVDTRAPSGTVLINRGAAYTKTTAASLTLSAYDEGGSEGSIEGMRFSNDGVVWTAWEDYATSKAWTLDGENGNKTVRVQYRDTVGNVSTIVRDTIVLDKALPSVSGMSPRNASVITNVTPTISATVKDNLTNLQKVNVKLYVNGVLISPTKYSYSASTDVLTYNSPRIAKGKKTVKVVATDAAKNVRSTSWYFTIR